MCELLEAINRGEFMLNGFRNRDLRALLFADAASASPEEAKRQAAKVTRLLGLLRAHGVITKVSKTHRYQVSAEGRSKVSRVAGSSSGQHRTTAQSRMREGVGESAQRSKKSNVSRTERHGKNMHLEYPSFDLSLGMTSEVDQQSKPHSSRFQIVQELGLVLGRDLLDSIQFEDDLA